MELSSSQRSRIKRAREVLDDRPEHTGDTADVLFTLSGQIGRLRFWLDDVLDLVNELAPPAADNSARSDEDIEDIQAYCSECDATIGHFLGRAGWQHFRGEGTAEHPNEIFAPGHLPSVAWRPAGTTTGEV